jgi:hypothetical protein
MRRLPLAFVGLIGASAFVTACGSTHETQTTATSEGVGGAGTGGGTSSSGASGASSGEGGSGGTPSVGFAASHPSAPRVITLGGPVLKAPKVYPIYFAKDDPSITAKITDFMSKLGSSSYWKATTEEYGVGAATAGAPIQLTETAPTATKDSAVRQWLAGKLNANDPAFPAPDDNTVYAIAYPAGVSVELDAGGGQGTSCQAFAGYHLSITLDDKHGSRPVSYMVIARCASYHGFTGIDAVTAVASHELVEAAQDPYPLMNAAYFYVDPAHAFWSTAFGGGETGDLCAASALSFVRDAELGYVVQRSWSNKQAAESHDPCVPAPSGEPYFNSAPVLPDKITIGGQSMPVAGVHIPVGQTRTVEIDLFSDAVTSGPWKVEALDISASQVGSPTLSFSFDAQSGVNADKLNLNITALEATPSNSELFILFSTLGKRQTLWVGAVGN